MPPQGSPFGLFICFRFRSHDLAGPVLPLIGRNAVIGDAGLLCIDRSSMLDCSEVCGDAFNAVEQLWSGSSVAAVATHDKPNTCSVADGVKTLTKQQTAPVCLVPECGRDLSGCPYYLRRHRVCETHMKAKTVAMNGEVCRFCQQCGRFQPLTDFKGDRKSCDAALKAHNARRRQMNQDLTVLVNDRRSRGNRRTVLQDEEPTQGSDSGARVSWRLASRRSKTARIAVPSDPQQQQQQQHRRSSAGPARREARSNGDQTASSRPSKSPSGSMQSCEEPAYQQQGATFPPFLAFHPNSSRTTSPCQHSSSAADGVGALPAQRAFSGSSDESGVHAQPPVGRNNFEGDTAVARRSRLGMLASGGGLQVDASMMLQQQQQLAGGYHPALCAGMGSTRGSFPGQQQGSLADWMAQHRTQDMQHQLQQLWSAAAVRAGLAGNSTGPQAAAGLLETALNPTLQPVQHRQQQRQHFTARAVTGSSAGVAGGPCGVLQTEGMQQQQPSLLQAYSSQQQLLQQQGLPKQPGRPAGAPAGQQSECGPDIWGLASTAHVPQQLLAQQQQQLGMSCQQRQLGPGIQQQRQQEGGLLGQPEPGSVPQQQQQQQQSLVAMLLDTGTETGQPPPAVTEVAAEAVPVSAAAAAAPDMRPERPPGASPDAAAAAAGGVLSKDSIPAATQHPPDNTLSEALDLLDVILAEDPDWQLVQSGSAATINPPTNGTGTSSSPGSSSRPLPNPCKRLSDVSWADLGRFDDAAAAAGGGDGVAGCVEGMAARCSTDVPQLPAVHAANEGPLGVAVQAAVPWQAAAGAVDAGGVPLSGALPCIAGPSVQPLHGLHPVQDTAVLGLAPVPDMTVSGPCTAGQQQMLGAAGLANSSIARAGDVGHVPSVPPESEAALGVGVFLGLPLLPEQQHKQHEAPLLSTDCGLAQLQQERLPAQQQLQQQHMLQELHRQLLQQHSQLQHYLVRLSVKLHGVMPDQLPSSTVQAMERLVVQNAGLMDAIMLQPSFRRGCVQMEFDLLVKPVEPMPAQQLQENGGKTAGKGRESAQGADCTKLTSTKQRPAQDWSDVAAALSSCPMLAAAEAQLRQALPFQLLLEALLALPLVSSTGPGSPGSAAAAAAAFESDTLSRVSSSSSNSVQAFQSDVAVYTDDPSSSSSSSSSSQPYVTASGMSDATIGCAVRAVYAQIGDCIGVWTAEQGLVQDWSPLADTLVSSSSSSRTAAAASSSAVGCVARPQGISACPLCTAVSGPGDWGSGEGGLQPLVLQAVLGEGCHSSSSSSSELQDDISAMLTTAVLPMAQLRLQPVSRMRRISSIDVQLWCTSGGVFVPLTSHLADSDAAAADSKPAAASGGGNGPVGLEVLLGLQESQLPGMLLLQAERLIGPQYACCSSSGPTGGKPSKHHQQHQLTDPFPLMSPLVPIVICPSAKIAAEVSDVLLSRANDTVSAAEASFQQQQQGATPSDRLAPGGTVSAAEAASLLQQLGLLMDYWATWQQQQQLQRLSRTLSDRQRWAQHLLTNPRYLRVIRSACCFWLMFAAPNGMSATACCLLNIWATLVSSSSSDSAAHAGLNGSAAGVSAGQAANAGDAEQQQPSTAAPAGALATGVVAATPDEGTASAASEAATAMPRPPGLTPADQWVFEDVYCGGSSSSTTAYAAAAGSSTTPTQDDSRQALRGAHSTQQQHSTPFRALPVAAVLVVLAALAAGRHAGWLRHVLHVLHAVSVPLGVVTVGAVLSLAVLSQQQEDADDPDFPWGTGAFSKLGADMPDHSEVYAKQSVRTQGAAGADVSA